MDVAFHPYTVVLCGIIWEPDGIESYYNAVKFRREVLHANFEKAGYAQRALKNGSTSERGFHRYLYNPCCHTAFGHYDFLKTVLVDDFDPVLELSATLELPSGQIAAARSPVLKSLGLPKFGKPTKFKNSEEQVNSPFDEFDRLLADRDPDLTEDPHSFQFDAPLVVLARLKLNGLFALAQSGIRDSSHFYVAVIDKLLAGKKRLLDSANSELWKKLEIGIDDVEKTKVVILESLGHEEFSVFIACNNYSIAMTLVAQLTYMTVGDIWPDNAPEVIKQRLIKLQDLTEKTIQNIPVFIDSHSVLGFTTKAKTTGKELGDFTGLCEAYCRANVLAGHQTACEKTISPVFEQEIKPIPIERDQISRFLIGRYDLDYSLGWNDSSVQLFPSKEIINRSLHVLSVILEPDGYKNGVQHLSTALVVPVPQNLLPENGPATPSPRSAPTLELNGDEQFYHELRKQLAIVRVPLRLKRTILYLFKEFISLAKDPITFDRVIDLWDEVNALHHLLTKTLPEMFEYYFAQWDGSEAGYRFSIFDRLALDQIGNYVGELHYAICQRVRREWGLESSDLLIDNRSGLSQFVHCASLPVKCGANVLSWAIESNFGTSEPPAETAKPVGIIPRLSLRHRWIAEYLRVFSGRLTGNTVPFLASIEFSWGHVLSPVEYLDHFHEIGHLVYLAMGDTRGLVEDELVGEAVEKFYGEAPTASRENARELNYRIRRYCREIFADLFCHQLIFGEDYETADKIRLIRFNAETRDPTAKVLDKYSEMIRFLNYAYECFSGYSSPQVDVGNNESDSRNFLNYARERTKLFAYGDTSIFDELEKLIKKKSDVDVDVPLFLPTYIHRDVVPKVLDCTDGILGKYFQNSLVFKRRNEIVDGLGTCFVEGKECWQVLNEIVPDISSMDLAIEEITALVCCGLHAYCKKIVAFFSGDNVHLRRNQNFTSDEPKEWTLPVLSEADSPCMIEPLEGQFFCCHPITRDAYHQITHSFLRFCWSLSLEQRAQQHLKQPRHTDANPPPPHFSH